MPEIKKIDIATELLEAAIYHYFETGSYFVAIQCAGAAEELLGKYVEIYDGESAFESTNRGARKISKILYGQESSKKNMTFAMNYPRNSTKHMYGQHDDTVGIDPKDAAHELIDRAVENYYFLMSHIELNESSNLKRFYSASSET